jgi:hypothetical protein
MGRMNDNEIGAILLHVPTQVKATLGDDWRGNLDPANLQRYNSEELRDVLGSLILHIQSQLAKGNTAGGQGGQDDTAMGGTET